VGVQRLNRYSRRRKHTPPGRDQREEAPRKPPEHPAREVKVPTAPRSNQQQGIEQHLQELHDEYAFRINEAIADNRDDLVGQFADAYTHEALKAQAACGLTPSLDRLPGRRQLMAQAA
jgi:hypothetical protein